MSKGQSAAEEFKPYNSADEKQVKERKQAVKNDQDTEADDIRWLMGTEQGRRVMRKLLERTGVFRLSYTGNSQTFFNEGQRNIGLPYFGMVTEHCPDEYILMMKEQNNA